MSEQIEETNVIDNKRVFLKKELTKVLPITKNASIAVGYFFISGLGAIIEPLTKVDKVRFLISNTTDRPTSEALVEAFNSLRTVRPKIDQAYFLNKDQETKIVSDSTINITQSLERMEQTIDDKKTVEFLLQMIKEQRLEIRIYPKEKLHAKAYIFVPRDQTYIEGMGIVGSSNLSIAGISENSELNLKTTNPSDVNKLLKWFNDLWDEGVEFTNEFNVILSRSWAGHVYSPRNLFLKAIYHESKFRTDIDRTLNPLLLSHAPKLYDFQIEAVAQCVTMIERYGGVIIGDVVGLGKTYVGTAILKYLQSKEYRPLIICPPALTKMWAKFCDDYQVDAMVISRGLLSSSTHNELALYRYRSRNIVLIDESHRFKNSSPRQYQNLHQFMQERKAKAILLTATPYSNKPEDIKNQIMLFHSSPKTRIPPAIETDLDKYFHQVKNGGADLTDLLRHIMIRRTRRYVLKRWGHKDEHDPTRKYLSIGNKRQYFPKREMKTLRYDINKVYQNRYEEIVNKLDKAHLTLARYSPGLYLRDTYKNTEPYSDLQTTGPKLVHLIRSLLLKRMESSFQAFSDSIDRYVNTHKIFIQSLKNNVMPVGELSAREIYDAADPELDELDDPLYLENIINKIKEQKETKYNPNAFYIKDFLDDIEHDYQTFNEIKNLISAITHKTDDKLERLQLLLDEHKDKKVIVFTEFASTAEYIYKNINWNDRSKVAVVSSTHDNAVSAARRFDPENNPSFTPFNPDSRITLLITTDVLSEGVNLQAGHVVINYDFHWNPVRLIQRVGRIDRIGSKNDMIQVRNFLPDPRIEDDLKLEISVDSKITEIQRVIGEDYKVLKEDEQINEQDLYAIYSGDNKILEHEDEDSSLSAKFDQILEDIHTNQPELWDTVKKLPYGIRASSNDSQRGRLLIACSSGTDESGVVTKYYIVDTKKKINTIDQRKALQILESTDQHRHSLPSIYDDLVYTAFSQFLSDIKQIQTPDRPHTLPSKPQRKIIHRLDNIARNSDSVENPEIVTRLHDAFSAYVPKGRLRNELSKIDLSVNDSKLVEILNDIYLRFELQKDTDRHIPDYGVPKILYSMYVDE